MNEIDELMAKWTSQAKIIYALVDSLEAYLRKYDLTSEAMQVAIKEVRAYYKQLEALPLDSETKERITFIDRIAIYGESLGLAVKSFNDSIKDNNLKLSGEEISRISKELKDSIDHSPRKYFEIIPDQISVNEKNPSKGPFQNVEKARRTFTIDNNSFEKRVETNQLQLAKLESELKLLATSVSDEIAKSVKLYENSLKELDAKKLQIDQLLEHASNKIMAGDFASNAEEEKKTANWLRIGSIIIMIIVVGVVGSSLYLSTQTEFDWKTSSFRLALALLLSIPAAYLARESSKHRVQQYAHQQTSLELKAISPFIASLPEETQYKIKIDVANKLFASNNSLSGVAESYPINIHELIIELLKKIDVKKT